jgi:hypothetical protein
MKKISFIVFCIVFLFYGIAFATDPRDKVESIPNISNITLSHWENDVAHSVAFHCMYDNFNFGVLTNKATSEDGAWQLAYAMWSVFNADVRPTPEFKLLKSSGEKIRFYVDVDRFGDWETYASIQFNDGDVKESIYANYPDMVDAIKVLYESYLSYSH